MKAYYNEIDLRAAQWLRNLIAAGHIAPGVVDTRSIEDVQPDDLREFSQCHFFAGVGVWSLALRRAGWSDDRPVWTGSCPCQPFSAAGKGVGFADERHLWPAFHHLISECKPPVVLGEQVASKDANPWIDLVHTDLESLGYAFGAIPFPSAGVGAPHIRDRLYWVANAPSERRNGRQNPSRARGRSGAEASGTAIGVADADGRNASAERQQRSGEQRQQPEDGGIGGLGDPGSKRLGRRQGVPAGSLDDRTDARRDEDHDGAIGIGETGISPDQWPGPTNGFWRDADWLGCTDGKWRPVEPGPQPLVDGSAEGLGRVRPEIIERMEGEINAWAMEGKVDRAEAMRDLLEHLGAEAKRSWPTRGLPGLHEAPFLLAFLRQLQEQGWSIAEGVALPGAEATSGMLRSVWSQQAAASPSCERGLEGQQPGESSNPVHFLSRLLALYAQACWENSYATYAEIGFPLARGALGRVGRLRAYGNAINAEAARVWVETVMEAV